MTEPIVFSIEFRSATQTPSPREAWCDSPALLFNQCDGYHHVFARFDGDGEFKGFYNWTGTEPYTPDFYCAWALLDDGRALHKAFSRHPAQGADTLPVTEVLTVSSWQDEQKGTP